MYAKFLWRAVHLLFGLTPPHNMDDLFNGWSKKGNKKENSLLLTVASALCWAVWITRNEVVFDKCRPKSFCMYYSGELTGSDSGQSCSGMMIYETSWSQLANIWSHQLCISSVPMDGFQQDLLVSLSQNSFRLFYTYVSL
jgi:hypothetical protein